MAPEDLILALVRTLHIGSAMLLVALPFFAAFIWRPIRSEQTFREAHCWGIVCLLGIVLVVEVLSGVAWLWFVAASMSGDSPWGALPWSDITAVITQTQFGQLWIVRGMIAVMLGGVLLFLRGGLALESGAPGSALLLGLGVLLLGSLAWAGHAVSGLHWQAWHLSVDIVHLLAGAVWPLGLIPLTLYLARAGAIREEAMEDSSLAVVRRFSSASFGAVFALVLSGVMNSWLMLPTWLSLFITLYGWLLIMKVLVVAVMIGLGGFNRRRLLPGLSQSGAPRLARIVAVESGLVLLVLLIVGLMGTTAPGS